MGYPSIIFFTVCAIPFVYLMFYLIRKDKNKFAGSIGTVVLTALVIAAILAIVFLVKDFSQSYSTK